MTKLDESNMDIILKEVEEFLQLYLFKGNVALNDANVQNLFELSDEDFITLKAVHFLLSDEVGTLIQILPRLVRNLAHATRKEIEIMRGIVRGGIDWGSTIKGRYSQGFEDKSLFVCNPSSKYYDLEENQLLKYLLKQIVSLKENYLNFISLDNFDIDKIDQNEDWYNSVNDTYQISNKLLRKVYFKDISDVKIKPKHLRKCMKSRNLLYHVVYDVYVLFESLFISDDDEDALQKLINERIIKTTDPNKLYEIYVFFNLIRSLPVKEHKLMFSTNDYSTSCFVDDLKITVHYHFTPPIFRKYSQYDKILENYVIKNHIRAPDVIIEFEKDKKVYYRIIEVKNTDSDRVGYVRDSVYKVMGYYQDFKNICHEDNFDFTKKCPIVLVTWEGIKLKERYNPLNDTIIILNRDEFIDYLDELVTL